MILFPHLNCSPKLGELSEGLRGLSPPRANQDYVCLLWGEAEVRVAFNDRAERYRSCNLVTERDLGEEL